MTSVLKKNDLPEIAAQKVAGQDRELLDDQPGEPEPVADLGDLGGACVVARDDRRRVTPTSGAASPAPARWRERGGRRTLAWCPCSRPVPGKANTGPPSWSRVRLLHAYKALVCAALRNSWTSALPAARPPLEATLSGERDASSLEPRIPTPQDQVSPSGHVLLCLRRLPAALSNRLNTAWVSTPHISRRIKREIPCLAKTMKKAKISATIQ